MRLYQLCDKRIATQQENAAQVRTGHAPRPAALAPRPAPLTSRPTSHVPLRRGVILLVVMVLLALMSLMGLTLVMVTAQGRLSALAAARNALQSEHDNQELATVIMQVVAGSTDPNSSFGAHGLLEDLYGLPQFFGRIMPGSVVLPVGVTPAGAALLAGGNNGSLLQFSVIPGAPTGATGLGPQSGMQYVLPYNSGAFCGQVITMLTGNAAGQSARVVGYYFNPSFAVNNPPGYAIIQVSSFGGVVPDPGDEFMINGRPFSGTGFGLDLTKFQSPTGGWAAPYTQPIYSGLPTSPGPLLTAYEQVPSATSPASLMPYAYLPNHARIGITPYLPTAAGTYWDLAGPGGANEPYDAPDFQNLMLAMHYWDNGSNVVTPVPSLHRPELVAWYYSQANGNVAAGLPANPVISMANPDMRRKVILRPEPTDHYFVDQGAPNGNATGPNGIWDAREPWYDANGNGLVDAGEFLDLNGDGVRTLGEPDYTGNTFNPVTGYWYITQSGNWAPDPAGGGLDVDNDADGIPDSIWVDAGLPTHTEADGTITKNLVAILCIDLDGKANLNAHGSLAQLDVARYPFMNPYNPWSPKDGAGNTYPANTVVGPLAGGTMGATAYNVAGRTIPVSQGYGPADVNLLHVVRRSDSKTPLPTYRVLLQGFNGYSPIGLGPVAGVDGRYGESARLTIPTPVGNPFFKYPGVYPPGSYANSLTPLSATQMILGGPRPGWSQWFDPFMTSLLPLNAITSLQNYWVNDAVALARFPDFRPGLLTPPTSAAPFFFDFLANGTSTHLPTAHGTPSDLHSRGFVATDLAGRPYYASTAVLPWLTLPATWSSQMTDLAVVQYQSGGLAFLAAEGVLNEGVDTPYEMNLTQNARQGGQNTGNTINGIPDLASVDAKLAPSHLEAILRANERGVGGAADTKGLVQRLDDIETAANYLATGSAASQTTNLGADKVRLAVTTESWDLPVPNIALTPQQMGDLAYFVDLNIPGNSLGNLASLNLSNISLADLARARIYAENQGNTNFTLSGTTADADWALLGNLNGVQQATGTFPAVPVWPLLAPETILGMRLNVNRLLGNGQDDNLNGVVDDPAEALWQNVGVGESLVYPSSQINTANLTPAGQLNPATSMNNMLGVLDLNDDGFYPTINAAAGTASLDPQTGVLLPADPTNADMRARQLLARHLYVTMMLLIDDRNVSAQIYTYNTASAAAMMASITPGTPPATIAALQCAVFQSPDNTNPMLSNPALAGRVQVAYLVAQWAINAVDFRDRDSIMTPFEFDIFPFQADDPTKPNITWNVDDIIGPAGSGISADDTPNPNAPAGTPSYLWRGLVWGCERPELLLTESLALHDRGTDDTKSALPLDNGMPDTYTADANTMAPNRDTDYDQVRRPRGSLVIELFNATNYWDAPPLDLQYEAPLGPTTNNSQPWQNHVDGNGNGGAGVGGGYGINLAQVASSQQSSPTGPVASPVWRVVIAYSPWYNESTYYGNSPGTYGTNLATTPAALDPRVPTIPSMYIHRAVYFTPYQQSFTTAAAPVGAAPAAPPAVAPIATGDFWVNELPRARSFFADPDVFVAGFAATSGAPVPATLMLPPSQYALVGSAAPDQTSATYKGVDALYLGLNQIKPAIATNSNAQFLLLGNPTGSTNGLLSTGVYSTIAGWFQNAGGATTGYGPYAAGYGATIATTTSVKPVIGVPIQTNWLNAAGQYLPHNQSLPAAPTMTLRMSVSEPEYGYPVWPTPASSTWDDGFYYSQPGSTAPGYTFAQHPFDSDYSNQYLAVVAGNKNMPNNYVAPDGSTNGPNTTLNYTVLYLQRLANPLVAWDAAANPYVTVDSIPVDLTAYTGENLDAGTTNKTVASNYEPTIKTTSIQNSNGPLTPANAGTAYANGVTGTTISFDTRRRGYDPSKPTQTISSSQKVANVWSPIPVSTAVGTSYGAPVAGTTAGPLPSATLGYLNTEYGAYYSTLNPPMVPPAGTATANQYYGDPQLSMPWYAWNNRPYVSQYELMLVPASTPSTMGADFGMLGWQSSGASAVNEYTPGQPVALKPPVSQFEHLLNFFENQPAATTGSHVPHMYRVFEFLQVPSRFTGTEDMLNPSQFSGNNATMTALGPTAFASHLFHPPFNWLSRYRDPGRINLNTIFDPVVFQALMDDYPGTIVPGSTNSLWMQFLYSRQGFSVSKSPYLVAPLDPVNPLNPPNPVAQFFNNAGVPSALAGYPTYFANPFRPDGSGAFVPPTYWNPATGIPLAPESLVMQKWQYPGGTYSGVNATLLRGQGATSFPTGATGVPAPGPLALFDDTTFDTNNSTLSGGVLSSATYSKGNSTAYRNAAQNPTFQYQMFTRLGNTTTNRSNVYAIWITLGKFQVEAVAVSPQNPDGYKLVKPYLDAAGNQEVTRGFYIFDRSIPMGFQRGQDINIERGMLVERVLQLPQ